MRRSTMSKELLDAIHSYLGRFIVYPSKDDQAAHTLWIVHTHLMDEWDSTPRLAFLSPLPTSGKTTALMVTKALVPNPLFSFNASPAVLLRSAGDPANLPTILYDEIDKVFEKKDTADLVSFFNAGYKRGATAYRCRADDFAPEKLPAYCALAMAGIGNIPDTILSRAIVIRIKRRKPDEQIEYFRERDHEEEGHGIRDRIAAWAQTLKGIGKDRPRMPDGVINRDQEVWEPLLAIADRAGQDWSERARV